jgi:hypothetical protein
MLIKQGVLVVFSAVSITNVTKLELVLQIFINIIVVTLLFSIPHGINL